MPRLLGCMFVLIIPTMVWGQFRVERFADGLSQPLYVTTAPGDDERLFVVEKEGRIQILDLTTGASNNTPFLNVASQVSTNSERGLLGLAFHPEYETNGLFYVNMTNRSGTTEIREFQVSEDPNVADPASSELLLSISQPFANHNGGWQGFGPDGYLYIATGDGGNADDPGNNSQDITDNLLGKMLRIDVNGDDFASPTRNYAIPPDNPFVGTTGDDEIWSYGLRNPWRASFDRETGDLYIGDVGQGVREEINVQPSSSTGGENFGWRLREGTISTPGGVGGAKPADAIDPVYEYDHGGGTFQGNSVTGGYVYRGPIDALKGQYIFGDFASENIWSFEFDGSPVEAHDGTNFSNLTSLTGAFTPSNGSINNLASFGEDNQGNLYIVDLGGEVFKVVPFELSSIELNGGGVDYVQDFDAALGPDGGQTGIAFPDGWSFASSDGAVAIETTNTFPISTSFSGTASFNAGPIDDPDRTLAIGRTTSQGNQLQLLAKVTDAPATSLQLSFDIEAWDARKLESIPVSLADDPGEAAFDVVLEVDNGNGFETLLDLGTVTTGANLSLPEDDIIDGNLASNRVEFDSGNQQVSIAKDATLRVRWQINTDAETRGWVFGLDNVRLSLSGEGGGFDVDFNGDGALDVADVDALVGAIVAGDNPGEFDVTQDGNVDADDLAGWLRSAAQSNGLSEPYQEGDANLDGAVDPRDLNALALNWQKDASGWSAGDFSADGFVNATDLNKLAVNWQQTIAASETAAVPEPSAWVLAFSILLFGRSRMWTGPSETRHR